jgi:ABC transport system ATP-binding/permease protein
MSESLLKAILRLFAVVAHEDEVTHHEREQIKSFLEDHLSGPAVESYLKTFDAHKNSHPVPTGMKSWCA